ncbi:MAG: hypothetical protein JJE04_23240 [Acidobacteriia bacterium]|nr:hypothetical protein [Terriglobia bacterium]
MSEKRTPRTASPKKAAASRANGAKSRGPLSPAGKARSAMNATIHGCYANAVLLVNEESAGWEELLLDFISRFNPIGKVELGLVEEMAAAHWRIRRYWFAESATLDIEMVRQQPDLEAKYELISEPERLSHAIAHFTSQPQRTLEFYHRLESRLRRHYSRALSDLLKIQQLRLQSQPVALPPDPPIIKNDETNPPASQPPISQPLAASQGAAQTPQQATRPTNNRNHLSTGENVPLSLHGPNSLRNGLKS